MERKVKPKLFVWHSPDLYRYAGLYVNLFGKRYRLIKVGNM